MIISMDILAWESHLLDFNLKLMAKIYILVWIVQLIYQAIMDLI